MRYWLFVSVLLIISGCAELPNAAYYTDPKSPGYTQPVYSGLCEQCGRAFTFSHAQWDSGQPIACPYDGHVQNLQAASQRYQASQQQASNQAAAAAGRASGWMLYSAFQAYNQAQIEAGQAKVRYWQCLNRCNATANIYSPNPGNRLSGHLGDCATICMNQ